MSSNLQTPIIRTATLADAKQLSLIAEKTFRDAFHADNTSEDLNLHCKQYFSKAIQKKEILDPNRLTLLCECNNTLIGFIQLRWGKFPTCITGTFPSEIQRFYLDKTWHGRGAAQELMNAAITALQNRESDIVWLGVWESNPRAIAFYEKFDFKETGSQMYQVGNDPQRDLIMARSLLN